MLIGKITLYADRKISFLILFHCFHHCLLVLHKQWSSKRKDQGLMWVSTLRGQRLPANSITCTCFSDHCCGLLPADKHLLAPPSNGNEKDKDSWSRLEFCLKASMFLNDLAFQTLKWQSQTSRIAVFPIKIYRHSFSLLLRFSIQ